MSPGVKDLHKDGFASQQVRSIVLVYCRDSQQVLEIYWTMGRARVQQVLKYGSWSLPIFVGLSCFDSSKQFRGDFKRRFRAILGDFGHFWAVLNDFALVLSAFQHASACEGCPRVGRVKVWVSQPSKRIRIFTVLVWTGPASIGEIYGIFMEILTWRPGR